MSATETAKSLAQTMHDGYAAEWVIEERLDEALPELIHHISSDHYDNSLEVYMMNETPDGFAVTEELRQLIIGFGFDCFWFNFPDGTEQHGTKTGVGPRWKVAHPRWDKEKASQ